MDTGTDYGMLTGMAETQKITIEVPRELLERAQRASGKGITETVRQGLRAVAASEAYRLLAESRGTWNTGISWQELKDDR